MGKYARKTVNPCFFFGIPELKREIYIRALKNVNSTKIGQKKQDLITSADQLKRSLIAGRTVHTSISLNFGIVLKLTCETNISKTAEVFQDKLFGLLCRKAEDIFAQRGPPQKTSTFAKCETPKYVEVSKGGVLQEEDKIYRNEFTFYVKELVRFAPDIVDLMVKCFRDSFPLLEIFEINKDYANLCTWLRSHIDTYIGKIQPEMIDMFGKHIDTQKYAPSLVHPEVQDFKVLSPKIWTSETKMRKCGENDNVVRRLLLSMATLYYSFTQYFVPYFNKFMFHDFAVYMNTAIAGLANQQLKEMPDEEIAKKQEILGSLERTIFLLEKIMNGIQKEIEKNKKIKTEKSGVMNKLSGAFSGFLPW